ncbi:MAG: hypothetical protein AAGG56_14705 [Pseudomonadota bacterium]
MADDTRPGVRHFFRIAAEWCTLLAVLGYGRMWLHRPFPLLRAFVPIALPFYLFHQTIIVLLSWFWLDWTDLPLAKALVIGFVTTLLSLGLAWGAAQTALTRAATGLPLRRRHRHDQVADPTI